jgi:hypothetical protein
MGNKNKELKAIINDNACNNYPLFNQVLLVNGRYFEGVGNISASILSL